MKLQSIVRNPAAFARPLSVAFAVVLLRVAVAQDTGLSATAEGLSSTASGSSASSTGLSHYDASSATKAQSVTVPGSASSGNDAGSGRSRGGSLTPGPCGAEYREERKRGKNQGSRLGCESGL